MEPRQSAFTIPSQLSKHTGPFPQDTHLQSVAKSLRLTLFLREIAHHGKSLIAIFRDFFAGTNKTSFWMGRWALGYHSRKFPHFPNIS